MPTYTKELIATTWPVGQGLCMSVDCKAGDRVCRIVYDCGSEEWTPALRDASVGQLQGRPLDLLVISHFHWGHVAGIPDLLNATGGARQAWVPRLGRRNRLLSAIHIGSQAFLAGSSERLAEDVMELAARPAGWLREHGVEAVCELPVPRDDAGREPPEPGPAGCLETTGGALYPRPPAAKPGSIRVGTPVRWTGAFMRPPAGQPRLVAQWAPVYADDDPGNAVSLLVAWLREVDEADAEPVCGQIAPLVPPGIRELLLNAPDELSPEEVHRLARLLRRETDPQNWRRLYHALRRQQDSGSVFLLVQAARVSETLWAAACPVKSGACTFLERLAQETAGACLEWCPFVRRIPCEKEFPTVLWCGDAPYDVLNDVVALGSGHFNKRLAYTSLWQVPSHGSASSLRPGFHKAISPAVGFISCGKHSRLGRPSPRVIWRASAQLVTEESRPLIMSFLWR